MASISNKARNANSIGIEMCSWIDANGKYYIKPVTQANAIALGLALMAQYNIDLSHCIRNYDVTGKVCPRPFVDDPAQWTDFTAKLAPAVPATPAPSNDATSAYAVDATTWAI